ncbi:HEAT repeat domain-containing protein [Paenibacillus aurantiacus]|uniref:HEAT repeat domain-containing protein n=1 Tax=Paenibacillus aurantiacus TaxID=1936118 RepID=A0ABV5KPF1_9BACL
MEALHSGEVKKVVDALLALTFHNDDWKAVQEICIRCSSDQNPNVRGIAILCFGHLARIHGDLEQDKVLPIVRNALNDPNEFVRSHATSALDDIHFFLNSH